MDREAWCAVIHGVAKSWIWLSDWTDWTNWLIHWKPENSLWNNIKSGRWSFNKICIEVSSTSFHGLIVKVIHQQEHVWAWGWAVLMEACVMPVFGGCHQSASLVAQTIKNLPAMRETWVQSLGWEYPPGEGNSHPLQYSDLENSMEEPGRLQSTGFQRVRHNFPFHHLLDL